MSLFKNSQNGEKLESKSFEYLFQSFKKHKNLKISKRVKFQNFDKAHKFNFFKKL